MHHARWVSPSPLSPVYRYRSCLPLPFLPTYRFDPTYSTIHSFWEHEAENIGERNYNVQVLRGAQRSHWHAYTSCRRLRRSAPSCRHTVAANRGRAPHGQARRRAAQNPDPLLAVERRATSPLLAQSREEAQSLIEPNLLAPSNLVALNWRKSQRRRRWNHRQM